MAGAPPDDDGEATLNAWMARLADGDREAFDPLYCALAPRALRLARSRLARDVADDAAQNALCRLFERASEFEPGRPVLPWFYAIVANEVHAYRRRGARDAQRRAPDHAADALSSNDDAESQLVDRELAHALEEAVASLDRESAEAIYAMLGRGVRPLIESPTFRKRVSRAYARLRVLLGGTYGR